MQRSFWWFSLATCVVSVFSAQCALAETTNHRAAIANGASRAASHDTHRQVRAPGIGAPTRHAMREQVNSGLVGIIFGGMDDGDLGEATDLVATVESGDLKILPVAGDGAKQNVTDLLFARGIDIGIVQTDALASLKRKAPFPGVEDFLQYITRLYDQEIHILAGSNIHSLNDLEDKRVNFGTPESGTYSTASTIFRALGVPVQTTFFPQLLALDKLRRGEISAVVYIAGKPARLFQGVRPEEALHFLPIPTTEALREVYTAADLSAEDYPGLIEEGKPVATLAVGTVLAVYKWPAGSERHRKVAHFVEAFFRQLNELRYPPHHPKWREVDIGASIPGWTRFAAASQWIKSAERDAGKPAPSAGAGSTQEPGPSQMTGAGSGDGDDPLTSQHSLAMLPRQPSASTSQYEQTDQLTNDKAQLEAFFRDFLDYQKQEASKTPDGPSQKEALFADFQAYLNRLQLADPQVHSSAAQPSGKLARHNPTSSVSACKAQC
jgi:uncharacterized protein